MNPAVRYGLIGGLVFTLILVAGNYFIEFSVASNTTLVYLKELVLIVSVIAGIKVTRDLDPKTALELKTGLKAGLTTVVIICAFIFAFNVTLQLTVSQETYSKTNDLFFKEYFTRYPLPDTSAKAYDRTMLSYDSSLKAKDYPTAGLFLYRARAMRPAQKDLQAKIDDNNKITYTSYRSTGTIVKGVFASSVFPQIVMGLLVSFVTTMIFRFKQQSEQ